MLKVSMNTHILKSLKNECRKLAGDIVGVYFLKLNGNIVYIGQSKNIKSRVMSHISVRQKAFDTFEIHECSIDELAGMEILYIKKYNPFYNVHFSTPEQLTNIGFLIKNNIDFSMETLDSSNLIFAVESLISNGIMCELHFNISDMESKPSLNQLNFNIPKKEKIPIEIIMASKYSGIDKKTLFRWSKEHCSSNYYKFLEIVNNMAKELNDKANKMSEEKQ